MCDVDMTEEDIDRAMEAAEPVTLTPPPPLHMSRSAILHVAEVTASLQQALGELLDTDVPPPGDTRKQLPPYILAMLAPRVYLSTACEMARACEMAVVRHPRHEGEFLTWARWLHGEQCRLNNKYSGALCSCACHEEAKVS